MAYRERTWDTRVGTIELQVPRVRDGSFFPSLLEPRRRAERALVAVVQEAYVQGVSTRRVDDLVQALGMQGISKSQVSRMCAELDEEVERFRTRKLEGPYPYVWLDGTFVKVRDNGRVVSQAIVIAIGGDRQRRTRSAGHGRRAERERRVLAGVPARSGGAWAERRQAGDQRRARRAEGGDRRGRCRAPSWQRCRVHFMRDALGLVPKSAQQMVAATIRTVFAQPDAAAAREQWRTGGRQLPSPLSAIGGAAG